MGAVLRFVFLWPRCGCVHTSWGIAGCLLGSQHTQQTSPRPGLIGIGYLATFYSSSYTTSLTFTVCPLSIMWFSERFWIAFSFIKTVCHLHWLHFASNTDISILITCCKAFLVASLQANVCVYPIYTYLFEFKAISIRIGKYIIRLIKHE